MSEWHLYRRKPVLVYDWLGMAASCDIHERKKILVSSITSDRLEHMRFATYFLSSVTSQIAKFIGPTWGPPGSCRPQMGPTLVPRTLLSGLACCSRRIQGDELCSCSNVMWILCPRTLLKCINLIIARLINSRRIRKEAYLIHTLQPAPCRAVCKLNLLTSWWSVDEVTDPV